MQLERVVTLNLRQGMREIEHRFGDNALIVSNQKVGGKMARKWLCQCSRVVRRVGFFFWKLNIPI